MNGSIRKTLFAGIITFVVSLVACGGGTSSSSASDTLTQAQFDTMLQASMVYRTGEAAVFLKAPNASEALTEAMRTFRTQAIGGVTAAPAAVSSNCPAGTIAEVVGGGNALNGGPFQAEFCGGGPAFNLTNTCPTSASDCAVDGLPDGGSILFDGTSCSGKMYISPSFMVGGQASISNAAVAQGAEFRYDPSNLGANDASTYYQIGAAVSSFTVQSVYVFGPGGGCQAQSPISANGYEVVPATTGLTAPIPGPVTLGTAF